MNILRFRPIATTDLAGVTRISAGYCGDPQVRAPMLSVTNRILMGTKLGIVAS